MRALATFDDGSGPALYAGGDSSTAVPGILVRNIARWDGTSWSAVGAGFDGGSFPRVCSLAVFDDGCCGGTALYAGGSFGVALDSGDSFLAKFGCPMPCVTLLCFGDGRVAGLLPCPCANTGSTGRGCDNSTATGGARLASSEHPFNDTLVLTSDGELASALSIFLQGNAFASSGVLFGDGVRCAAGSLKRLYVKNAVAGTVSAPQPGDASIRQQSANLGDPISAGSSRWYQVYYRDPVLAFCSQPQGNSWNVSNGLEVWGSWRM